MEVASAAARIPLTDRRGNTLPYQYPDHDLTIWCIGYGEKHIGQTIYRLFFKPGVFKVIKDLETGKMRAFDPYSESDMKRIKEAKPSPPLIPPRLAPESSFSWVNKRAGIFERCELTNGNTIYAYTSIAKPKMGDPVDIILIDEDIEYPEYVPEWQARLSDRKGRLYWAAFPLAKNPALMDMSERADAQKGREYPDVEEWVLAFSDNPYIDEDEKRKRREGWSEEERRARDLGEFVTDSFLVYPSFSDEIHGIPKKTGPLDAIEEEIERHGGQIPPNWTRYLVLDPGHSVAAVLFAATPPPQLGDAVVLFDEIYGKRMEASQLAREVKSKMGNQEFEAFLIDYRAGRQSQMGQGETTEEVYARGFKKERVLCNRTGNRFTWGSDNVPHGIAAVREMLEVRPDGTPQLRVMTDRMPNFKKEMALYRKKITQGSVTDEPIQRNNHLMDCLRYLAAFKPRYVKPTRGPAGSWVTKAFKSFTDKGKGNKSGPVVCGPAGEMNGY